MSDVTSPASICILGRQPALGLAELEALYGSEAVEPAGESAAIVRTSYTNLLFNRLGGSVKAGEVLAVINSTKWDAIEDYLLRNIPARTSRLPEGKLTIGLSAYGFKLTPARLNATGLSLKKAIRKFSGRPVRLVPNKELALSSAQTFHNRLTDERSREFLLARSGDDTIIARAFAVQDIDGYTLRDRSRPKRDSRVGMLPPKLAQIIVNLAVGTLRPAAELTVLDPFCGTGVILQETLLMGYSAYGTDLEARMIDYTGANLDWLDTKFDIPQVDGRYEQGDATEYTWDPHPAAVAAETYLGRPFTTQPPKEVLEQTVSEVGLILKKFLKNIHGQLARDTRLCLAVPAWQIAPGKFRHLPLVDQISDLGYNLTSFKHVRGEQLLYYREDQIVARELLVLTRK